MDISKETFEQLDADSKLNVLFDLIVASNTTRQALDEKLDRKKRIDTTVSAFFGFVGGALAVLGQRIFLGKS